MRSGGSRTAGGALWALLLSSLALSGCGDSPAERRAEARAEAERRFARPSDASAPDTAPGATVSSGAPIADREATRGEPSGETAGAADTAGGLAEGAAAPATPASPSVPVRRPPSGDPTGGGSEGTGRTPEAGPMDPDELLAEADRAYSGLASLRAAFVQRVDVPLLDRTTQGHGTWYQEGRDRFRMDFEDPPGDAFVADGTHLWLYQPSANPNQVLRCVLAEGRQTAGGMDVLGRILSEARSSYEVTSEGTAIVSGRSTHAIALRPIGPSEYRFVRVWIDEIDRLVRRFRIEEENETIRTVTLSDLEPNVPLEDSLFEFAPPPGVEPFAC